MFTESDVKSIFALFPPQTSADFIPQLALASSGHGFVTLQFVQAQFRSRVVKDTERISLSALASDLDIDPNLVHQLVRNHPKLCLLSADQKNIITIDERDALREKLINLLSSGVQSKHDFVTQNNIWPKSLDALLADQDDEIINIDDFLCTNTYENTICTDITNKVKQALEGMQTISIFPGDLPGTPPVWFILRTLEKALEKEAITSQINITQHETSISCTPKQLLESRRTATISNLTSGTLAYLDLTKFAASSPEQFPTYEVATSHFQRLAEIEIIDTFAVSKPWISSIEQDCIRILEQEGCTLDVAEVIGSRLPSSIVDRVATRAKDSIISAYPAQEKIVRVGHLILTETRRNGALDELAAYAKTDASAQWEDNLTNNPTAPEDLKYSRARIQTLLPPANAGLVQRLLTTEKAVEKSLEAHFWTAISALEEQNEEAFATYWHDRLLARFTTYKTGLSGISDAKLAAQLADLLASHAQTELIPDTVSRARAQGMVLSRKTRKNVARLESILDPAKKIDLAGVSAALDKFSSKQNISTLSTSPDSAVLASAKQTMMNDMLRRLHKQKQSDGPVLFLTLVIVLFARRNEGVVYATGKFAPKLLKLLKGRVGESEYERLEAWKEGAKTGKLTAEDRRGMLGMAEQEAETEAETETKAESIDEAEVGN
ncbi:hypothetical protein DDE82_007415 [Stemphylium lycopersici]|nr:hypothetical protein DDE82_007415 [Stemphylium lycopersici]